MIFCKSFPYKIKDTYDYAYITYEDPTICEKHCGSSSSSL